MTTSQDIIKEYQHTSKMLTSIEDDIANNRAAHLTAMEKSLLESNKDLLRYYMKMLQKRKNEAEARESVLKEL